MSQPRSPRGEDRAATRAWSDLPPEGERPIRITWELLEADLPAELLERSRTAVA